MIDQEAKEAKKQLEEDWLLREVSQGEFPQ
jgi:hypothetical protein